MRLSTTTHERNGVTLVELLVRNDGDVRRRVRIANRLDGPAWPPRRDTRPEAGWDEGGYEGVLAPGETRALGYAVRASARDPPAEVVEAESATGGDGDEKRPRTAGDVVTDLGDPRPPRDVVDGGTGGDGVGANTGVGDVADRAAGFDGRGERP